MFLALIFGVLGIVLIAGGAGTTQARRNPNIQIGLWIFGVVGILVALVVLFRSL